MRIIIQKRWDTAAGKFLWTEFTAVAALTNGVQIIIDGQPLFPEAVKDNHDWKKYAYDTDIVIDGAETQIGLLTARLSVFKMLGNNYDGLMMDIHKDRRVKIKVKVQDDLSEVGTELKMIFQGWRRKVKVEL